MPDDRIEVDASELTRLSADVGEVPPRSGRFFRSAVEVGSRNVRDTARQNATGMAHAPQFPRSITYDIITRKAFGHTVIEGEIGPDKARPQGSLGNLIEYGSVKNPPQGIMHGALQANEEDFDRGVNQAVDDALKGVGL